MSLGQDLKSQFDKLCPAGEPLAVAVSGGADSVALLGLTLDWAAAHKVHVHALIVDHGLRVGSDKEAQAALTQCQDMGATAHILTWSPPSGLNTAIQEAARVARYSLMGELCRNLGISALLVGHHEDDQAETIMIRQQCGAGWRGMAGMAPRIYAPVWPGLHGVSLLRPLLGVPREALRDYNRARGRVWTQDPSNQNSDFQRVRVRKVLNGDAALRAQMLAIADKNRIRRESEDKAVLDMASRVSSDEGGALYVPRSLSTAPHFAALLSKMIVCAAGARHRPDMAAVTRLADALQGTGQGTAQPLAAQTLTAQTLGGAIITPIRDKRGDKIEVARETGRWLELEQGEAKSAPKAVFDGRGLVSGLLVSGLDVSGLTEPQTVQPLWLYRKQLPAQYSAGLKAFSPAARRSLAGIVEGDKLVGAPQLGWGTAQYESLTLARLRAI